MIKEITKKITETVEKNIIWESKYICDKCGKEEWITRNDGKYFQQNTNTFIQIDVNFPGPVLNRAIILPGSLRRSYEKDYCPECWNAIEFLLLGQSTEREPLV